MYLQTFILTSLKNIFHVSDRVRVHIYVIISSSLKPYQNFGPDLSLACLLMFSVVVHDQRDRQFHDCFPHDQVGRHDHIYGKIPSISSFPE